MSPIASTTDRVSPFRGAESGADLKVKDASGLLARAIFFWQVLSSLSARCMRRTRKESCIRTHKIMGLVVNGMGQG